MTAWFGFEYIEHDDEDDGDGHDEDGWHGNDESGRQVTLSCRIFKAEVMCVRFAGYFLCDCVCVAAQTQHVGVTEEVRRWLRLPGLACGITVVLPGLMAVFSLRMLLCMPVNHTNRWL